MKYVRYLALATAVLLAAQAPVMAAAAYVPETGSAQGVVIPHALPGADIAPHVDQEQHIIAPTGAVPQTAAQSVQSPNSLPLNAGNRPGQFLQHNDVQGDPNYLPQTGSEQGAGSPAGNRLR